MSALICTGGSPMSVNSDGVPKNVQMSQQHDSSSSSLDCPLSLSDKPGPKCA